MAINIAFDYFFDKCVYYFKARDDSYTLEKEREICNDIDYNLLCKFGQFSVIKSHSFPIFNRISYKHYPTTNSLINF